MHFWTRENYKERDHASKILRYIKELDEYRIRQDIKESKCNNKYKQLPKNFHTN